jgi:type II secretory pathway pseudopilin PulG
MKLNTRNMKKRASGMTLLELTVVILVLLSLISILFIGARAWKKGADRAGCIMNIRNMQQAARSQANMYGVTIGDALNHTLLIGSGKFMSNAPTCPGAGSYGYTDTVPTVGGLYMTCSLSASPNNHVPATHGDW